MGTYTSEHSKLSLVRIYKKKKMASVNGPLDTRDLRGTTRNHHSYNATVIKQLSDQSHRKKQRFSKYCYDVTTVKDFRRVTPSSPS